MTRAHTEPPIVTARSNVMSLSSSLPPTDGDRLITLTNGVLMDAFIVEEDDKSKQDDTREEGKESGDIIKDVCVGSELVLTSVGVVIVIVWSESVLTNKGVSKADKVVMDVLLGVIFDWVLSWDDINVVAEVTLWDGNVGWTLMFDDDDDGLTFILEESSLNEDRVTCKDDDVVTTFELLLDCIRILLTLLLMLFTVLPVMVLDNTVLVETMRREREYGFI